MRVTSREKEGRRIRCHEVGDEGNEEQLLAVTLCARRYSNENGTEWNGMEWKRKKQGEAQSTMTSNRTSNWKREESSKSNVGRVNYCMNQFSRADYTGNIVL